MRIPTYDNKVSPSGGQPYRSVPDLRSNGFDALAQGLEGVAAEIKKREDEEIAIADYTNMANADLAITQLGENLKDEIANGGKYSDAEKRFNEGYQKIMAQYSGAIKDPRSKAEFAVRAQKAGLQYNLQIKDARRSRIKSDATSAANNRISQWEEQLVRMETGMGPYDPKQKQAVIGQIAGEYAKLEGLNVIGPGAGQQKLRELVGESEKKIISIMSESNPEKALSRLEKSYQSGSLDSSTYASMLGPINNKVEALRTTNDAMVKYKQDPIALRQGDVDTVFNVVSMDYKLTGNEAAYKTGLVELVSNTHKVPTQIQNQMSQIMAMQPESMTAGEAEAFADLSQTASEFPPQAFEKMPKQTQAAINFVNDQVDAGVPVVDAVKRVSMSMQTMSDPKKAVAELEAFKKRIYKESEGYLVDKLDSFALARVLPGQQAYKPTYDMQRQFETMAFTYSTLGMSDDDAQKKAYQDLEKTYQPFDGKMMKYSPSFTTGLPENKFKEMAITKPLIRDSLHIEGADYTVVTDTQAESEFMAGERVTYPLYMKTDTGVLQRVMDKQGRPLRTMPVKVSGYKQYVAPSDKRGSVGGRRGSRK